MIYVGNFSSWINPSIINTILTTQGSCRPKKKSEVYEQTYFTKKWQSDGIDLSKIGWTFYFKEDLGIEHLDLPINVNGRKYQWWFSKLNPGDILPMHADFVESVKIVQRFYMVCQDHQPGHVFTYEGHFLENYKAGDMFELVPVDALHGAANLGSVPKITLQICLLE